jgi:hypothetical protein
MNRKPLSIRRPTTVAVSAVLLSAVLPTAPVAADAEPEDHGPGSWSPARGSGPAALGSGPAARGSGPAVYVLDGRVVAIRRSPLPPGAYGGQGVDWSPDMTAWILDPPCG